MSHLRKNLYHSRNALIAKILKQQKKLIILCRRMLLFTYCPGKGRTFATGN